MEKEILDIILDLLADRSCNINEISTLEPLRKIRIGKLTEILTFFDEYDFIELSEKPIIIAEESMTVLEAKLTPPMQEFWRKIKWMERAEKYAGAKTTF